MYINTHIPHGLTLKTGTIPCTNSIWKSSLPRLSKYWRSAPAARTAFSFPNGRRDEMKRLCSSSLLSFGSYGTLMASKRFLQPSGENSFDWRRISWVCALGSCGLWGGGADDSDNKGRVTSSSPQRSSASFRKSSSCPPLMRRHLRRRIYIM